MDQEQISLITIGRISLLLYSLIIQVLSVPVFNNPLLINYGILTIVSYFCSLYLLICILASDQFIRIKNIYLRIYHNFRSGILFDDFELSIVGYNIFISFFVILYAIYSYLIGDLKIDSIMDITFAFLTIVSPILISTVFVIYHIAKRLYSFVIKIIQIIKSFIDSVRDGNIRNSIEMVGYSLS